LRAGVDDLVLARVHGQRAHRRCFGQAPLEPLPFFAAVGQPEKTGLHHPAAPGFSGQA